MSDIEWTDRTWNPIVGCTRVSPGCEHCYAERFVHRGLSPQHKGLTVLGKGEKGPRWTGEVRLVESALAKPLSWRKPQRVFVNSLSDLFHEKIAASRVAAIFAVMAACPHLTFQVLTKRPANMRLWFDWFAKRCADDAPWVVLNEYARGHDALDARIEGEAPGILCDQVEWPLPNVWIGVTAEDQQRADERIPLLLDTPAAVRFVSYEPALGPVDFRTAAFNGADSIESLEGLHWLIVGGESGPGARPFDVAWMLLAVEQCRASGVPVFCKQIGAEPFSSHDGLADELINLRPAKPNRKGGDMAEWPPELRVREFPR